uniref:Alpha-1,3-mannosyl-glycoprotein 2-beta-N-acetylglucosaminyltransferase n=1 Tax=Anas platyrhynchos TaxID=8839 RepID=A0A8B9QYC3_ANAPL
MLKKSSLVLWGAALFIAWNGLLLLFLWSRPPSSSSSSSSSSSAERSRLTEEVIRLAQDAETELERQKELLRQIHRYSGLWGRRRAPPKIPQTPSPPPVAPEGGDTTVLPVLVLACDRSTVRRCLG